MPVSRISFDPAPSGSPVGVISPSSTRIRLSIYAPATGMVTISQDPNVAVGSGINLVPGSQPLELDAQHNGDMVRGAFFFIYSGVISPASWVEVFP